MLISIDAAGQPLLPLGSTPSTWIVKPNIRGFDKVWSSAVNEAILMRAAAHCGMNVAESFFEPVTRACVVKRFDRIPGPGGSIARLQQYDFCQLSGMESGKKYESEGGSGIAQCAELIRSHSAQPAVDMKRFCEWIFFNFYTRNNDSHAKNLSLYTRPGQGASLTPFYDLMDTRFYPGLSFRFAFRIGGEDQPGKVTRAHVLAMASELNLKPRFVLDVAHSLHAKIEPSLQQSIDEIASELDHAGRTLAQKLQQHVLGITAGSRTTTAGFCS